MLKKWFDTSKYSKGDKRPLPIGMNKKKKSLFKDELVGQIMNEFVALRPKTYCCAQTKMVMVVNIKKAKGAKKCVIERETKF